MPDDHIEDVDSAQKPTEPSIPASENQSTVVNKPKPKRLLKKPLWLVYIAIISVIIVILVLSLTNSLFGSLIGYPILDSVVATVLATLLCIAIMEKFHNSEGKS